MVAVHQARSDKWFVYSPDREKKCKAAQAGGITRQGRNLKTTAPYSPPPIGIVCWHRSRAGQYAKRIDLFYVPEVVAHTLGNLTATTYDQLFAKLLFALLYLHIGLDLGRRTISLP